MHSSFDAIRRHAAWGLLTLSAALAHAEGYTSRELKPPMGSPGCNFFGPSALSDNGDVVAGCSFLAGFYLDPIPIPNFAVKPVVFRNNGSVSRLSLAGGTAINDYDLQYQDLDIDGQGRVMGSVAPVYIPKRSPWPQKGQLTQWIGSSRTAWVAPSGFAGFIPVSHPSPLGKRLLRQQVSGSDGLGRLAVLAGQVGRDLSLPPINTEYAVKLINAVINDAEQVAITLEWGADVRAAPVPSLIHHWFWDGANWTPMALPAMSDGASSRAYWDILRVNQSGAVLFRKMGIGETAGAPSPTAENNLVVWRSNADISQMPGGIRHNISKGTYIEGDLAASGDVVGMADFPEATEFKVAKRTRAAIWRNGQATDLNTLVRPPSGLVFYKATAVNKRGQILVETSTTAESSTDTRTFLFTPK